jgi:chitinase
MKALMTSKTKALPIKARRVSLPKMNQRATQGKSARSAAIPTNNGSKILNTPTAIKGNGQTSSRVMIGSVNWDKGVSSGRHRE